MSKKQEMIFHPDHYNAGSMEVIDAIEGLNLGFHEGSALKYLARWKHKYSTANRQIEDLEKAVWYIQRQIVILKIEEHMPLTDHEQSMLKKELDSDYPTK